MWPREASPVSRAKGDLHSKRSAVASIPFVWALTLSVISASLDRPPLPEYVAALGQLTSGQRPWKYDTLGHRLPGRAPQQPPRETVEPHGVSETYAIGAHQAPERDQPCAPIQSWNAETASGVLAAGGAVMRLAVAVAVALAAVLANAAPT